MNTKSSQAIAIEFAGNGYELLISHDGHAPLVRDLELARWLEIGRDRKIRDLITRWLPELGEVCTTVVQTSDRGGRPGREYHLTEEQALFIAAKSETPRATQLLKAMIAVFMEARRRLGLGTADAARQAIVRPQPAPAPVRAWDKTRTERDAAADDEDDIADHLVPAVPVPTPAEVPLRSIGSGSIELGGFGFACSMLSDGRSVLMLEDFYSAFGKRPTKAHKIAEGDVRVRLPAVLCREGVVPFVSWRLPKLLEPISYRRFADDPGDNEVEGVDPAAVTEVCATILRAVAAGKIHINSTKAVGSAVKVLSAVALCPWEVRIREACGVGKALVKPVPASLAQVAPGLVPAGGDPYELIADAVAKRLRARRVPTPVTSRMSEPEAHELRRMLQNIEGMLLDQAARGGDL